MKVFAIDIMSGDRDPKELFDGCISSLQGFEDIKIVVVAKKSTYESLLEQYKLTEDITSRLSLSISETIVSMDEHPAAACKQKPTSTVMIGTKLLKEKAVDAFFSPGNTGATLAASLYNLGRLKGVKRPAIGVFVPTKKKGQKSLILDAGANVDCAPKYLRQFAIMGAEYYKIFFDKKDVNFGLLNIGEEEEKGNDLALDTFKILKDLPYRFKGNVEPKYISEGEVDVVVCDGFVGNVFLKTYEAAGLLVMDYFKKAWKQNIFYKIGIVFLRSKFKEIKGDFDPSEIGCAPLIGIDGNVFIGHGGSDARTVYSAVRTMMKCLEKDPLDVITERIKNYG